VRNLPVLARLLRRYARPYRRAIAAVVAFQLVSGMSWLLMPAIEAAIIDDGVVRGNLPAILHLGAALLGVCGLEALCSAGAVYFGSRTGVGLGRDLRLAVFHHVTEWSPPDIARFGVPSLLTRTTNDVQQIQTLMQMTCTVLITAPIISIGGIFMAMRQNVELSRLLLISVPALALANYWIVSRLLPVSSRLQRFIDSINEAIREQLSGIRVIRAFTRESFERRRFGYANDELSEAALATGRWQALLLPINLIVINLSSVALIWFGGLRLDAGRMRVGSMIAFLSYFLLILTGVLRATFVLLMVPRASVCAARIGEVLSTDPAITSPQRPMGLPEGQGVVRLQGAAFAYPGANRPVLQDVSLTALPGTTTAIVGSTGAGKSTLVAMICRLCEVTEGSVAVDGFDVRDYDLEALWSVIGLVPQRGYLFSGTVADNLRYGNADATDAEIWEALRVASADGFVSEHPDGLGMRVSQGGVNFSGGQRQRLAIARAVVRRPKVYLLDDAFSALDPHTEARVREGLREVSAGATVLIVSQRISTIIEADQVIVIDDGRIVGSGTHESLLTDCPTYAQFVDSQSIGRVGEPL
jgi:ATP-binding cassette subfamily B multidrug efflux pump